MKKQERDLLIDGKLKELEEKKSKIQNELLDLPKFKTNMKLIMPGSNETLILRTVKDIRKLVMLVGELSFLNEKWEKGIKECSSLGINISEEYEISGYKISDWIEDIKSYLNKLNQEEELKKIEKAIQDLPKFYTEDRKDDIEFDNLLNSL